MCTLALESFAHPDTPEDFIRISLATGLTGALLDPGHGRMLQGSDL